MFSRGCGESIGSLVPMQQRVKSDRRHRGKLGEQMSDLSLERIVPDLPPMLEVIILAPLGSKQADPLKNAMESFLPVWHVEQSSWRLPTHWIPTPV